MVDEQNRPHNPNGPFCEWRDGSKLYSINGIRVPGWVCETASDKLDPIKIMKLKNAEERLVAIKKCGMERMLSYLKAKSISTKGDEYELFEVELEGSKEKLLRLKNPSENKQHYEFVEPHIKTVIEALSWRRGIKLFKEPIFKT